MGNCRYYMDSLKLLKRQPYPLMFDTQDEETDQTITVSEDVFGVTLNPYKTWSPFCEKLFVGLRNANGIILDSYRQKWDGNLAFLRNLATCKRLSISCPTSIDLSALEGNLWLEDLKLSCCHENTTLNLSALPKLRRCAIPMLPGLSSVFSLRQLTSLYLDGGSCNGPLSLEAMSGLEEFIGIGVRKLKKIKFHPATRLRALQLSNLPLLTSIKPLKAIIEELRVVSMEGKQQMGIEWLGRAKKVRCISLAVGNIPSIKFLSGLQRLSLLNLFGSKVLDRDLSVRDALPQDVGALPWAED